MSWPNSKYIRRIVSYFDFLSSHPIQQIAQQFLAVLLLKSFEPGRPAGETTGKERYIKEKSTF